VTAANAPEVLCIGPARLTAGLDRLARVDLTAFGALFGALRRREADELIAMAAEVDLRGRGGAAFPVARKLASVRDAAQARGKEAVVLVNATEGEPGSAKDRMLLTRSPYLVLGGAMLAAWALESRRIVIGVTDAEVGAAATAAAAADPKLRKLARVVKVPDRFVSGEGGALVNAVNGKAARPPGRKVLPSDSGVSGMPTLLSNAETFAQLAVLALLGPDGYARAGSELEPGTVLLTVGGAAGRPAVVEVPAGLPLGRVLDHCAAAPGAGVLVGGYHGRWLPPWLAPGVPVSRAGLTAAGGTLGAGVVLTLEEDTCAIGEVARVAAYLASQSSGQCGPCALGLPAVARSLAAVADGSGGQDAVEAARRTAAAAVRRGACAHPDGVFRFVQSALEVFAGDVAAHVLAGACGRPVRGVLPLPAQAGETRLEVDWARCQGHGLCSRIVPELVQTDSHGYPAVLGMAVPPWLERDARRAVAMCPALALRLTADGRPAKREQVSPRAEQWPAIASTPGSNSGVQRAIGPAPRRPGARVGRDEAGAAAAAGPLADRTVSGTVVSDEEWIAELSKASGLTAHGQVLR